MGHLRFNEIFVLHAVDIDINIEFGDDKILSIRNRTFGEN